MTSRKIYKVTTHKEEIGEVYSENDECVLMLVNGQRINYKKDSHHTFELIKPLEDRIMDTLIENSPPRFTQPKIYTAVNILKILANHAESINGGITSIELDSVIEELLNHERTSNS